MKPIVLFLALTLSSYAKTETEAKHTERWYQELAAKHLHGVMEHRVENGRVDILTATHAIEVEFASKWKNAIGQSLWYALQTNERAGIILVIQNEEKDRGQAIRLGSVIQHNNLPIDVWIWPDDFKN